MGKTLIDYIIKPFKLCLLLVVLSHQMNNLKLKPTISLGVDVRLSRPSFKK